MRLLVLLLAACVLAMPTSAQAYWTYLNIKEGAPLGWGTWPKPIQPNFNYARACKTPMNVPGVGPMYRVRLQVGRNSAYGTNAFIRAGVHNADTSSIRFNASASWYSYVATVDIYGAIFSDQLYSFYVYDGQLGLVQIGRHWSTSYGGMRYMWRSQELADC